MADLAAAILAGNKQLHDVVGKSAGWLVARFGAHAVAQAVARELVFKLPLPIDDKAIAVARGLQVTGIVVCLFDGRDLTRCPCFRDLARTEAKTRVKVILVAALDDWDAQKGFAAFGPTV